MSQKKCYALNLADHEHVLVEEFGKALKSVLLKPMRKKSRWENREPTKKELSVGFKLSKKKCWEASFFLLHL